MTYQFGNNYSEYPGYGHASRPHIHPNPQYSMPDVVTDFSLQQPGGGTLYPGQTSSPFNQNLPFQQTFQQQPSTPYQQPHVNYQNVVPQQYYQQAQAPYLPHVPENFQQVREQYYHGAYSSPVPAQPSYQHIQVQSPRVSSQQQPQGTSNYYVPPGPTNWTAQYFPPPPQSSFQGPNLLNSPHSFSEPTVLPQHQSAYYPQPPQTGQPQQGQRAQQPAHDAYVQPRVQNTPQHRERVVSHVEVAVPPTLSIHSSEEMPRSPKRRRSNDGHAAPASAIRPEKQIARPKQQAPASSSPLRELRSLQVPIPPQPSVDYQAVLLGLVDEYLTVAYNMSSPQMTEEQSDKYYSLLATAMGCLQSVLIHYREPDPRKEARVRLRLANLLVEETENDPEAEEVLSKGIALCERGRLVDLKYAMQFLLVRLNYKSNPKRAFKTVDQVVKEVEAYRLTNWVYTFRFLRVSLTLQRDIHSDTAAVLKHLNAISALASEQRHVSVQIIAALLEGMVHLSSGSADAVELAQRAMAAARTHQLGPEMKQLPQARLLLDWLDLLCSLINFKPEIADEKMRQMQSGLEKAIKQMGQSQDGLFSIELGGSTNNDLQIDTGGIMSRTSGGYAALTMQWMTKEEFYTFGYLLSGLASMLKNSRDGKAEQFLAAARNFTETPIHCIPQSLSSSLAKAEQRKSLNVIVRLYIIFVHCSRYDWETGRQENKALRQDFASSGSEVDAVTRTTLTYQEALCRHGLGDLDKALRVYGSADLQFDPSEKNAAIKDMQALAALNSVFILRSRSTADSATAAKLFASVESYCLTHTSKSMLAAHHLIKATADEANGGVVKTKHYLQLASQASKGAENKQLKYVIMNIMASLYFKNIVGDQAYSAVKVARSLATTGQDNLWLAVASGMYASNKERCGQPAEAEEAKEEGMQALQKLPQLVQEKFVTDT